MKTSKIKRLVSKKLALQFGASDGRDEVSLANLMRREGAATIAKMRAKGFDLVSCLETGEGVFVREDNVVGLHIQLPAPLYRKLDAECRRREATKRTVVVEALERHLS